LDGVVWRGDEPIAPAAAGIAALRAAGLCVAFVSNNSNSPVGDVVAKLARMGVPATEADVVTSATAAAWLLAQSLAPGARVLACAGSLVAAVATAAGSTPEVAGKPEAPTVGLIRERFGTTGVVVGDRPSTDGALATAIGWPFALVLSGVTAAVAPPGGEAIPD